MKLIPHTIQMREATNYQLDIKGFMSCVSQTCGFSQNILYFKVKVVKECLPGIYWNILPGYFKIVNPNSFPYKMENNDEATNPKRIRLDLNKKQKEYPSDSADKRKERNLKNKETKRKSRGRLDFYYSEESEKVELFNKIDKIKLSLGEGQFNKVSTFAVLHRLCDFFISANLTDKERRDHDHDNQTFEPMYQCSTLENAMSDEMFAVCLSSVQKLINQVQAHDSSCNEKLNVENNKNVHSVLTADIQCKDCHVLSWTSSPHMENGKFLASAKLCHGYFSSGMLPSHFQKFCEATGIGNFGDTYVNELIKSYKEVVEDKAKMSTADALQGEIAMTAAQLPDDEPITGINIITDARHCWRKNAKFSDVVCIGNATNKCLRISTVTKDDDPSSQRHELIGVKQIYNYLDENDCPVNVHAHDNNNQINKFVREDRSPTENANDTWHLTKGISKSARKITTGSKSTRGVVWHEELSDKAAAIKTHIYHSMKNCKNDPNLLRSNILSVVDHYQGNHGNCMPTSRCKTDPNYESSKYIIKDEKAVCLLTKYIKSLPVFKDAEKYKYCMDTHYVESFNNALLQYVDKRISFGLDTYKMRINLTILDWNENVNRPKTSDREIPYKRDPSRKMKIPVLKRKTTHFKDDIWLSWLECLYN